MRHFSAVFLLLVLTARYGFAEHPNGFSMGIVSRYNTLDIINDEIWLGISLKMPSAPIHWSTSLGLKNTIINSLGNGKSFSFGITGEYYIIDKAISRKSDIYAGLGAYIDFGSNYFDETLGYAYLNTGVVVPIGSSFWIADFFETYVEIKPSFGIGIDFEGKSDNYTLNNGIYHEGGTGLKFGLLAAAGFRFWTESRRNVPVAKTRDTGAAFVQPSDISWGFGGALNILYATRKGKEGVSDLSESVTGGGGFVFMDFTYLEIDIDILSSNSKTNVKDDKGARMYHFGLSALLKFPFNLTYIVALFPLVGIDYQIFIGGTDQNSGAGVNNYSDALNFFSIAAGIGADFALGRIPYLRLEFLWDFKFLSPLEKFYETVYHSQFISGPRIKLALGFKFGGIRTIRLEESEDSDYWYWEKIQ